MLLFSKSVRNKLLFTLGVVLVYRLLASIPLPGINMAVYQQQFGNASASEANYLLTIFTGGQLDTPSIVGLGIGVYITASIVMQLLGSVVPYFKELRKEGNRGRQIIDQYTRYLTVPLSFAYGLGYLFLILQGGALSSTGQTNPISNLIPRNPDGSVPVSKVMFMALVLTAGSLLMMWLAELITENGIGNGSSVMIMVGILTGIPAFISKDFASLNISQSINGILAGNLEYLGDPGMKAVYLLIIGAVLLIAGIVWMNESVRKLTIQYARRDRTGGALDSSLPIKLDQSGVMPIIFASSLLSVPQLLIPVVQGVLSPDNPIYQFAESLRTSFLFDRNGTTYLLVYVVMIIIMSMVYATIALNPGDVSEDLQKSGAFIPGIRPGKSTEGYITKVLLRLTFVGSLFLGVIAIIPLVAGNTLSAITDGYQFSVFSAVGGTSILIVVGVILDTVRQIRSLQSTQSYERYI